MPSKLCVPDLEGVVRSFIITVQRGGHGQLIDILLPKSWLSVHSEQKYGDSYGGERKSGFISLPGKEGTQ